METLILSQHRSQYYSRSSSQDSDRFGSSPSRGFREINCRTFQSGAGILPTPYKSFNSPSSVSNKSCTSPKTPQSVKPNCDEDEHLKNSNNSHPIPINSVKDRSFSDDFSYSELWAGPAYSNSPPPSSLPLPKFSLRQKRSASFELPVPPSGITIHQFAKSAPTSPTRESSKSASDFFLNVDSATKDLRRILNLDIGAE
ncbi:hypothetical protein BVC80_9035g16 [Macleaya cordata]|uniref:Uncharacterized protein n=1 Tax=Macleaya cordata TaxID=56857 RepID=A0A200QYH7_MACCD|nr:hypothetical protein BVC80_9035g16 [Macleaya cordata]